jgi:hypothetical protein
VLHAAAGPDQERIGERRSVVDERVILAALTRGVQPVGDGDVREQIGVEIAAQKVGRRQRQVDAHHDRAVAALDHLVHQFDRRLAPQRLHVVQPLGAHALLVPAAHVLQVDVAEHHALAAAAPQIVQQPVEDCLEPLRTRVQLHALELERLGLCGDQLAPHTVKPDSAAGPLVDVGEVPHVEAHAPRAVQRQGGVFAAAAHQGVRHGAQR